MVNLIGKWFCRSQKPLSIRLTYLSHCNHNLRRPWHDLSTFNHSSFFNYHIGGAVIETNNFPKYRSASEKSRNHHSTMFQRHKTSGIKNTSILCHDRNGPYQQGTLISGEVLTTSKVMIPSTKLTSSSHKTFHFSFMKFLDEMSIKVKVSSILRKKTIQDRMSRIQTRSPIWSASL